MTTSAPDKEYDANVVQLLKASPIPALRQLTVEITNDTVDLSGTVNSFHLKQLAQDTILPARGNRAIVNRIRVSGPGVEEAPSTLPELLRGMLVDPSDGIVALVDDLAETCLKYSLKLKLSWHADQCHIRSLGDDGNILTDVPLRKSVFRAVLARVATLCNQRNPNSVSTYGGQGELAVAANPAAVVKVAFVNTPANQSVEMTSPDQAV